MNVIERAIQLTKTNNLPPNVLQNSSVIVLTIVATVEDRSGYTVVIISIISEPADSTIEFEEESYRFNTEPDRVGVIGAVRAVSTSATESITYSISATEGKNGILLT